MNQHESAVASAQRLLNTCKAIQSETSSPAADACAREQAALDEADSRRQREVPVLEERLKAVRFLMELATIAVAEEDLQGAFPNLNRDIVERCINTLRRLSVRPTDDTFADALALCYAVESTPPVSTAYEMGWAELRNGALLTSAEESFDLLITTDRKRGPIGLRPPSRTHRNDDWP